MTSTTIKTVIIIRTANMSMKTVMNMKEMKSVVMMGKIKKLIKMSKNMSVVKTVSGKRQSAKKNSPLTI